MWPRIAYPMACAMRKRPEICMVRRAASGRFGAQLIFGASLDANVKWQTEPSRHDSLVVELVTIDVARGTR